MGRLGASLRENLDALRREFDISSDLVIREITVAGHAAAVVSIEGMVDRHMMTDAVLLPLLSLEKTESAPDELMHTIRSSVLGFVDLLEADTLEQLSELLVSGFAAVLLDGVSTATLGGLQAFMIRSISEPSTEVVVRGSREGFTEAIRVNVSMIRRRMKHPNLTFEMLQVGTLSQTAVCLCYVRGRVSEDLLETVRRRIESCPLESVLESGYLQPFIEGDRRSLFTGVEPTERPDTLCGKVAEGRIGILVDGTPFALVVPYLFTEHFQTMDDYTEHPVYATFVRWMKYIAFLISLLLPALYVAVGTHHAELLPVSMLLTVIGAARTTPFSLTFEALLIHFLFEIMREAGLRFPKSVGHAVSIVGALVIGESAVRAGLIGAPMVIVVALTSMSAFVLPNLYGRIAVLRFLFIILGGALGLYGVLLGVLLLLCSVCSVEVQSIPITAPVTPFSLKAMRDVAVRADWRTLCRRVFRVQNVRGSKIGDKGDKS